jgi:hypothetical protein
MKISQISLVHLGSARCWRRINRGSWNPAGLNGVVLRTLRMFIKSIHD